MAQQAAKAQLLTRLANNLKSKEFREYLMSTHFWGPVCNWSIPVAAFASFNSDPATISGGMTAALSLYSAGFMRFAWKVQPRNMLLFSCHMANFTAQNYLLARFFKYNFFTKRKETENKL